MSAHRAGEVNAVSKKLQRFFEYHLAFVERARLVHLQSDGLTVLLNERSSRFEITASDRIRKPVGQFVIHCKTLN